MATTPLQTQNCFYCARCNGPFALYENMAKTGPNEFWHLHCFVCAQCFRPFNQKQEYWQFEGKNYCEKDFKTLFAPCCNQCNKFIIGRFIRALNKTWHPNCFLCQNCHIPLADLGFVKNKNRALCHNCNTLDKTANANKYICNKCKAFIEQDQDGGPLKYKDETYHAYHFNCHSCGIELRPDARQVNNDLYCLKCYDKMGIPICGACRRPIEERVVTALGKHWHIEHFACAICEKPFLGKKHYEVKGQGYCEKHYHQFFGHQCQVCSQVIIGDVVSALDKYYCVEHFACFLCKTRLEANNSKFYDVDSNPCCSKCYKKLPSELRKRLAKQKKLEKKVKKEVEKQRGSADSDCQISTK